MDTRVSVRFQGGAAKRRWSPKHDDPSAAVSKPPEQVHRKPPTVLLHPPPLQIRGFSSHSSTSAHVRRSAVNANPVLRTKARGRYETDTAAVRNGAHDTYLQEHAWLPGTFTHTDEHPPLFVSHSSTSVEKGDGQFV